MREASGGKGPSRKRGERVAEVRYQRRQALLRKTAKQQTAGQAPHGVTPGSIQRRNELGEDESVKSCIRSIYTNFTNNDSFYILVRPGLAHMSAGFFRV